MDQGISNKTFYGRAINELKADPIRPPEIKGPVSPRGINEWRVYEAREKSRDVATPNIPKLKLQLRTKVAEAKAPAEFFTQIHGKNIPNYSVHPENQWSATYDGRKFDAPNALVIRKPDSRISKRSVVSTAHEVQELRSRNPNGKHPGGPIAFALNEKLGDKYPGIVHRALGNPEAFSSHNSIDPRVYELYEGAIVGYNSPSVWRANPNDRGAQQEGLFYKLYKQLGGTKAHPIVPESKAHNLLKQRFAQELAKQDLMDHTHPEYIQKIIQNINEGKGIQPVDFVRLKAAENAARLLNVSFPAEISKEMAREDQTKNLVEKPIKLIMKAMPVDNPLSRAHRVLVSFFDSLSRKTGGSERKHAKTMMEFHTLAAEMSPDTFSRFNRSFNNFYSKRHKNLTTDKPGLGMTLDLIDSARIRRLTPPRSHGTRGKWYAGHQSAREAVDTIRTILRNHGTQTVMPEIINNTTFNPGIKLKIANDRPTTEPEVERQLDLFEKSYKLQGRTTWRGLNISIENRKGSVRVWGSPSDPGGGRTKMHYAYGYIRNTEGADGDQVDCYLGPNMNADKVYIVRQMKAPDYKEYDEDKCMLGFDSPEEAKAAYLKQYTSPKFFGKMDTVSAEKFAEQIKNKTTGKGKNGKLIIKSVVVTLRINK